MIDRSDFDVRQFGLHMRCYQARLAKEDKKVRAENNALMNHPVTPYFKSLPKDSPIIPLYPAISYHQFTDDETVPDGHQERIHCDGTDRDDGQGTQVVLHWSDSVDPVSDLEGDSDVLDTYQGGPRSGKELETWVDRFLHSSKHFISWSLPAQDITRPRRKGCGFIRASDGTMVYTACSHDDDHFIRAKRRHCWSLRCPDCMNDTALRSGSRSEERFLAYIHLMMKMGNPRPEPSHWVVSPPQDFVKRAMQTYEGYDALTKYIETQLSMCGGLGGNLVFHPWRQKEDRWVLSPHFHSILFGRIDTKRFLRDNPGWIIKKVHSRQSITSIKHTIGYLQTHCGVASVEVNPDSVDWDLRILSHFVPGLFSGGDAGFDDDDYDKASRNEGRMVGDLSDVDWLDWTMRPLSSDMHQRYWGVLSSKSIRKVDVYRQYKIRTCSECGSLLRTYDGFSDIKGDYVRYIVDDPVMCFARDAELVKSIFLRYKTQLRSGELTVFDIVECMPLAVCPAEYREDNGDIIVDGPFAEPDEYFLQRQRKANHVCE